MYKRVISMLLVVLMIAGMTACAKSDNAVSPASSPDPSAKNVSTEEIKIGLYGTITGSNALAGEMMEKGGQLAVKQINEAGGVNGHPVKLVVYDDKSTPEGAVKAVTRLVDVDKVTAIVGSNSSPNILATTQITEEAKVIQVGGGTSPKYTNAGFNYIFRGTANADLPNKAFVDTMKGMGIKKVALFYVASEYGKSGIESVKALLGSDVQVITEETYQATDTDYTGQIAKIINAKPEGVIVYGMTNELALSLKQFRRNGYEGYVFGPEGLGVPDIIKVAGDAANGVIFGSGAVIPASVEDATNEVEKAMLKAFVAEYGALPVSDVAYRGYDSVVLICEALRNATDINNPDSIREAFLNIKAFPGIAGTFNFSDGSGDGLKEARTYIIDGGKNVLYKDWKANK
ncbi:MAG: hypothetical protein APF77_01660 [Clostridia bacterium BRH_c25]|nr:MAG: hypothetical protein APF77_01660 [Clostridia bacterium BRH_c25]